MANWTVDFDGVRYEFRYVFRAYFLSTLQGNAVTQEPIAPPAPPIPEPEAPLNNGDFSKAAGILLAKNGVAIEDVPAGGGKVKIRDAQKYLGIG